MRSAGKSWWRRGPLVLLLLQSWGAGVGKALAATTPLLRGTPVAFLKTHKTGSTTMASILFRHAARHGLAVPDTGLVVTRAEEMVDAAALRPQGYDMLASHLTPKGGKFFFRYRSGLAATRFFYQNVLHGARLPEPGGVGGGGAAGERHGVELFTLLRHPAKRLRSHFDYYLRSTRRFRGGFDEWVGKGRHTNRRLVNYQCNEVGLYDAAAVDTFLRGYTDPASPRNTAPVQLLMVVERLDVCLLLLRRRLIRAGWDWELSDLVHLDQKMTFNWLGKPVNKSGMSAASHALVCEANPLDLKLWAAARAHVDVLVEHEKQLDGDGGRKFEAEARAYADLQARLEAKCAGTVGLGCVCTRACVCAGSRGRTRLSFSSARVCPQASAHSAVACYACHA